MLRNTYAANIIPRHYRGMYPAVYLYDWFDSSGADDMDMALNMYVLEEIKAKLDRIIANQSEMILNQRMMLANQQRSIEAQEAHARDLRASLDRIEASNEERNQHLRMIESDMAVTRFMVSWNYFNQ